MLSSLLFRSDIDVGGGRAGDGDGDGRADVAIVGVSDGGDDREVAAEDAIVAVVAFARKLLVPPPPPCCSRRRRRLFWFLLLFRSVNPWTTKKTQLLSNRSKDRTRSGEDGSTSTFLKRRDKQ